MDKLRALGLGSDHQDRHSISQQLHLYINLKLASCGQPTCNDAESAVFMDTAQDLLNSYLEKNRQLAGSSLYPADRRIQNFLERYLADLGLDKIPTLPTMTFELDRHGVARELSLPLGADEFKSEIVSSYRVKQGVLHNPASDRRTT
ncbi:MAG: hypothetical protein KGZ69_10705, partial [Methylomonas sp.]|nr:hypothetical protein [Methylomonas sp.]